MTWRADNQGINAGQSGAYVQKQRMTAGQDNVPYEGYRPTEGQNGYYPAAYPAQKPYYPNQEQGQGRVDNQPVQEQRQMENGFHPQEQQGRNRSQSAQKGKGLVQKILAGILAAAVLIVGGIFLTRYLKERADYRAMEEYVRSYDTLFVPGVYVDEIALEGMNMAQAQAMVQSNAQQRSSAWSVNLTYNGQVVRTITGSDLSMNVDVQDALAAAWNQGHIGTVEDWDIATNALASALTSIGKTYVVNPGDGAFYGPKLDFHIEDSLGRTWQCGTIQLDYQLPGRFNLEYVGADGEKHCPVMIHRVVFGSIERFIGVITEHYAGAFPVWLSPVQAVVMPITDRVNEYAEEVTAKLNDLGFRVESDLRNEKIGYKIREAQLQKTPYMLVVGDKEKEAGAVAVRTRSGVDLGAMPLDDFIAKLREEVDTMAN